MTIIGRESFKCKNCSVEKKSLEETGSTKKLDSKNLLCYKMEFK